MLNIFISFNINGPLSNSQYMGPLKQAYELIIS